LRVNRETPPSVPVFRRVKAPKHAGELNEAILF
jgi:hypothetical protein